MKFTESDSAVIDKCVSDCLTFGIRGKEAIEYIRVQTGRKISPATLKRRFKALKNDDSTNGWLSYFTRIGFVKLHREQLDNIQNIQNDSVQRYTQEYKKEPRDERLIMSLKQDIRENAVLLSQFSLGTPVISAIKAKLQEKDKKPIEKDVPLPTSV